MILTLAKGETHLCPLADYPEAERAKRLADSLWVDLFAATAEERALVSSTLKVELFSPEELREIEESSRIFMEEGDLNLVCWLPSFESAAPLNLPVGFIVDEDHLISMRDGDFHAFRVYSGPRRRSFLPKVMSSSAMLVNLLDTIVGQLASTLRTIEQDLNQMSLEIFSDTKRLSQSSAFRNLKSIVQRLGRRNVLVSNLRESAITVSTLIPFTVNNSRTWMSAETTSQLKILGKDLGSLKEYNEQLASEIAFLLDSTMGLISVDQNQSMKFLGVAALVVAFV
ncbi:MAG: hypothetical protein JOZ58_13330 [Acetobacteraceae bacterium]|nr:hypothetical protein [Acetobacteraceae bacterium]